MVELKTELPLAKLDRSSRLRNETSDPLLVPKGTRLLSRGVEVTSSDDFPLLGEIEMITDGNEAAPDNIMMNGVELIVSDGLNWVQLDLGRTHALYAILVWHYYSPEFKDYSFFGWEHTWAHPRAYQDVVVQISNDPVFKEDVTTVFNNDHDNSSGFGEGEDDIYVETSEGRWIDTNGLEGRYVRLYSNGYNRYFPKSIEDEPKAYDKSGSWIGAEYMFEIYEDTNNYIEVEVYGK